MKTHVLSITISSRLAQAFCGVPPPPNRLRLPPGVMVLQAVRCSSTIQLVILYILWEISWISLSVLNVWLLKYSLFTLLRLTWSKAYLCQQRSAEISTIIINIIMNVNIKSFAFISKCTKHFITNPVKIIY